MFRCAEVMYLTLKLNGDRWKVRRPHYSVQPIRFWSRSPSEFYVTQMHSPRISGKTPYKDQARKSIVFTSESYNRYF